MAPDVRIAAPCNNDWNTMVGDDRSRYCSECQQNVYNFSAMSRSEVDLLLSKREGRLCGRIQMLPDGTMLTADPPSYGVFARASRLASATMTAVLSLSPALSARSSNRSITQTSGAATNNTARPVSSLTQIGKESKGLSLTVMDVTGAVIPDADVAVVNGESTQNYSSRTDQAGQVQFPDLPSTHYDVSISSPGFMESHLNNVTVPAAITVTLRATEQVTVLVGEVVPAAYETKPGAVTALNNPNLVQKLYRKIVSWFSPR